MNNRKLTDKQMRRKVKKIIDLLINDDEIKSFKPGEKFECNVNVMSYVFAVLLDGYIEKGQLSEQLNIVDSVSKHIKSILADNKWH